jgi:hypothetical protein
MALPPFFPQERWLSRHLIEGSRRFIAKVVVSPNFNSHRIKALRQTFKPPRRPRLVVPHNFELALAIWTDTLMMATGKVA